MNILTILQATAMADVMRSEGKIYVVVAGLLILLVGVLAYLFMLDKKISKVEKEVENNK